MAFTVSLTDGAVRIPGASDNVERVVFHFTSTGLQKRGLSHDAYLASSRAAKGWPAMALLDSRP
jgi:hypothetical protein